MRMLLSAEVIAERVKIAGRELSEHFHQFGEDGEPIVIAPVLLGSMIFLADLIRTPTFLPRHRIEPIWAKSYQGDKSTGKVDFIYFNRDVYRNKNILIVEDILDEGHTLREVSANMLACRPRTITTVVAFNKNKASIRPEFSLFHIPDKFVVGYGLDYNGLHRNLPFLGVMEGQESAS